MDTRPLDVRTVPLCGGVIQGQGQPGGPLEQRPDHLGQETPGDAVGLLAGGSDGDVAGLKPVAELGRPDPGGDGPPTPSDDSPEKRRASLEADRRSRAAASQENHWHGTGVGCEDVMAGSVRDDRQVW